MTIQIPIEVEPHLENIRATLSLVDTRAVVVRALSMFDVAVEHVKGAKGEIVFRYPDGTEHILTEHFR